MVSINKFYNESCLDTIKRFNDDSIDLVVTSPPYFNARDYSQYDSVEKYMEVMEEIFSDLLPKLKQSRMCIINISPVLVPRENRSKQSYRIPLPFYFVPMMEKIGYEFLEDIIWKKPDGAAPNRNGGFFRHRKPVAYKPNIVHEYILVFKKPAPFLIDKVLRNDSLVGDDYDKTSIWEFNPETKSKHPAPFPKILVDKAIRYYSYTDDLIYDPFGGSGTTGLVAESLNRNWVMSEIHKKYIDIFDNRK